MALNDSHDVLTSNFLFDKDKHKLPFKDAGTTPGLLPKAAQPHLRYIAPRLLSNRLSAPTDGSVKPVLNIVLAAQIHRHPDSSTWDSSTFLLRLWSDGTTDLHEVICPDGVTNLQLKSINAKGVIAALGNGGHALLLVPVDMQVDANRDGQIVPDYAQPPAVGSGLPPPDTTSPSQPYRFWINDDNDGTGTSTDLDGNEVLPPSAKDYAADTLQTKRGLEDFSRLWLHLPLPGTVLQTGKVQLGLRWKPNPLHPDAALPRIKLFRAADKGTGYLTDDAKATEQVTFDPSTQSPPGHYVFCPAVKDTTGSTMVGSGTFILPKEFWQDVGVSETHPDVYLLFEGVGDGGADAGGQGCLEYVFLDQNGHEYGSSGGIVYLELRNIKSMYERGRGYPNDMDAPKGDGYPKPYDYVKTTPPLTDTYCMDDTNGYPPVRSWDEDSTQYLVYIHGWNVGYTESQRAAETIYKRLWHRGYKGRFAFFRWPTLTVTDLTAAFDFNYNSGEYRAWKFGPAFKQFLNHLRGELPIGGRVNVAAHSQGNVVTAAALMPSIDIKNHVVGPAAIDTYILWHAAISANCYDPNVHHEDRFITAETVLGPTPQTLADGGYADESAGRDQQIAHGYLEGVVGKLVNFYDPADEVLAKWATDNELVKPVIKGLTGNATYQFDLTRPSMSRSQLRVVRTIPTVTGYYAVETIRNVTDTHERMALLARSLSYSVGQRGDTHGPVDVSRAYNLQDKVGKLHSGDMELPIQKVYEIYNKLLDVTGNHPIQN